MEWYGRYRGIVWEVSGGRDGEIRDEWIWEGMGRRKRIHGRMWK